MLSLVLMKRALKAIAHEALSHGAGARGLRAIMKLLCVMLCTEVPSRGDVKKCVVTEDCC